MPSLEQADLSHGSIIISDQGHSRKVDVGEGICPPVKPPFRRLRRVCSQPFISYEALVWTTYGVITILAIVDRFTWQVWPREIYRVGKGTAGSDFKNGLKPGPWSVKAYDAIARISGRYSILALNLLMFTMSHTTYGWLAECWLARHVVNMTDYVEANRRIHKWNGIGIAVMTLAHVWTIILPCITHSWRAQVVLGNFEWILSERGPKGFKDANVRTETMSLQGDDVFRIVEMTILLAILLPLSVRWLSTRWHFGVQLHSIINILYFIDIVRRHTHPHSWILNTPFFVYWIVDTVVGVYWRREKPEMFRVNLSEDYMLLFWAQHKRSETVGPKYYVKMQESSRLERAHVFTGFENRLSLDLAGGRPWTTCLLVRVYRNKRKPRLGRKDFISQTYRIAQSTNVDVWTWGPFVGDMSDAIRLRMELSRKALTLVAGGSAAGYLIDAVQQRHVSSRATGITCLYSTRDPALFNWVADVMAALLQDQRTRNVHILLALTHGENFDQDAADGVERKQQEVDERVGRAENSTSCSDDERPRSTLALQYGRMNFVKSISPASVVYFQGSGGLQKAVRQGCKANKCRLFSGPAYDNDATRKKSFLRVLKNAGRRTGGS